MEGQERAKLIEELGFKKEELAERIVERAVGELLCGTLGYDNDEGEGEQPSAATLLAKEILEGAKVGIERRVKEVIDKEVLPHVDQYIDGLILQPTTPWGEQKGPAKTVREYVVHVAETYLMEQVDYDGKKCTGYRGEQYQTRLTHMIHRNLAYEVERGIKAILADANSLLAKSIVETVKVQMEKIQKSIAIKVTT